MTMVGLDVTTKCRMRPEHLEKLRESRKEAMKMLCRLIELWQEGDSSRMPVLHDALAVGVLIDPSFIETRAERISVEARGELTRGFTVPVEDGKPGCPASVGVDVHSERFLRFFVERLIG